MGSEVDMLKLKEYYDSLESKIKTDAVVTKAYTDKLSSKTIENKIDSQLNSITASIHSINNKFTHKNLELDVDSRQVHVNGEEVSLTVREFDILELLITNPNKVFTRANLFESVWKDDFMGDDNTVNVHISNLRSKLSKVDKDNEYIQTVWGIGFKLKD